jgi:hypothetical protein
VHPPGIRRISQRTVANPIIPYHKVWFIVNRRSVFAVSFHRVPLTLESERVPTLLYAYWIVPTITRWFYNPPALWRCSLVHYEGRTPLARRKCNTTSNVCRRIPETETRQNATTAKLIYSMNLIRMERSRNGEHSDKCGAVFFPQNAQTNTNLIRCEMDGEVSEFKTSKWDTRLGVFVGRRWSRRWTCNF